MQSIKREIKKSILPAQSAARNSTPKWITLPVGKWLMKRRNLMIRKLEQMDKTLSNRQRKWLFYLAISCCSGLLLYLLGSGIHQPPALFVPPPATHLNSPVKSYPLQSSQDRNGTLNHPIK